MGEFECSLCEERFESPVALLEHEAVEDDRLYFFDFDDDPADVIG